MLHLCTEWPLLGKQESCLSEISHNNSLTSLPCENHIWGPQTHTYLNLSMEKLAENHPDTRKFLVSYIDNDTPTVNMAAFKRLCLLMNWDYLHAIFLYKRWTQHCDKNRLKQHDHSTVLTIYFICAITGLQDCHGFISFLLVGTLAMLKTCSRTCALPYLQVTDLDTIFSLKKFLIPAIQGQNWQKCTRIAQQ